MSQEYAAFVKSLEPSITIPQQAAQHDDIFRLLHAALGLTTEVGEFVDALKKKFFAARLLDRINLIEELGDIRWYYQLALNVLETSDEEVIAVNTAKLKKRHGDKFNQEQAGNYAARDLGGERTLLEEIVKGASTND